VVFGPASEKYGPGVAAPVEGDALRELVVAAGAQLDRALDDAQQQSHQWNDAPVAQALVDLALSRCLNRLADSGVWGTANQQLSTLLWQAAGHWLQRGWLQQRARFKPRGYAGDWQMLQRICDQSLCDDPLGRHFDRYFLQQAAPAAVRNRTEQTAAAIVEHVLSGGHASAGNFADYQLVSVGCGPALDVRGALGALAQEHRARIRVTLLDLDDEALQAARTGLADQLADDRLRTVRDNLFRLAERPRSAAQVPKADFLVCVGMFDYLSDEVAAATLGLFWQRLRPGGRLLVGNFAPHNPTRAYMEWIGNWYLVYRTADEMRQLAAAAGIAAQQISIGAERLGIDLFLSAVKAR